MSSPPRPTPTSYKSSLTEYHLSLRRALIIAQGQQQVGSGSCGSSSTRGRGSSKRDSPTDYQFTVIQSRSSVRGIQQGDEISPATNRLPTSFPTTRDHPHSPSRRDTSDTPNLSLGQTGGFSPQSHPAEESLARDVRVPIVVRPRRGRVDRHESRRSGGYWNEIWESDGQRENDEDEREGEGGSVVDRSGGVGSRDRMRYRGEVDHQGGRDRPRSRFPPSPIAPATDFVPETAPPSSDLITPPTDSILLEDIPQSPPRARIHAVQFATPTRVRVKIHESSHVDSFPVGSIVQEDVGGKFGMGRERRVEHGGIVALPELSESGSPSSSSDGSVGVDAEHGSPASITGDQARAVLGPPKIIERPPSSPDGLLRPRRSYHQQHQITLPLPPPARILFARQLSGVSSRGGGGTTTDDSEDSFDAVQDSPMCTPMVTPPQSVTVMLGRADSGRKFVDAGTGTEVGYWDGRMVEAGSNRGTSGSARGQSGPPRMRELTVGQVNGQDGWRSREHPVGIRGLGKIEVAGGSRSSTDAVRGAGDSRSEHGSEFGGRRERSDECGIIVRMTTHEASPSRHTFDTIRPTTFQSIFRDDLPVTTVPTSTPNATPDRTASKTSGGVPASLATPRSSHKIGLFRKLNFHRKDKETSERKVVPRGGSWFEEGTVQARRT